MDDIKLILSELESIKVTIRILKSFEICAGLKINVDKMQAKYIGLLSSRAYFPRGVSWIKTHLETLGIVIIDNDEDNYKYNFPQKILTFKSILNIWKIRKLSLKGKRTVLNSLELAPLFIYLKCNQHTQNGN